jgi:YVTN family beta-propeller protein
MTFNFLKRLSTVLIITVLIFLQSCKSDPDPVIPQGTAGFFVVNEGGFGNGNASLAYYDRKADVLTNNIFTTKNGRPLGDQAQSMTVFENRGYIVVQNSGKIEVINADDFASVGSVTNLPSPRYFIGISATKGYVSDWGADGVTGTVKVIDLSTLEVIKTIQTGKGANRMLKVNNLVYVANSGGYDKDNTVKVIDSNTDAIVATITIGDNPNSLQRDKDGNIWVASSGYIVYNNDFSINETASTKGSISKISASNTESLRLTVDKVSFSAPSNLVISPDGTSLYYMYEDAFYSLATTATALPTAPLKSKSYYGLAVDPTNGMIIGCNAPNFSSAGTIEIFNTRDTIRTTYPTGIAPNGIAFK